MTDTSTAPPALLDWVERAAGGSVVRAEPLPRWRAGWFLDVETGAGVRELYARGARNPDFPSPYPLAHEVAVHDLLEAHGFPVPHAHGVVDVDGSEILVMDRVHGVQGLAAEPDEATRAALMRTCVEHIERMHRIPLDDLTARGFEVPGTSRETVWSGAIARLRAHYEASTAPRDPVIEYLVRWLERHEPPGRDRPAFVTWDAAQFLHLDGALTALIDFELAHVGDPYMDLAPLRSRDTMEPFGDLGAAFARYEELSGAAIDFDVVRYFEVAQLTATLMLQRPVLLDPHPDSDLMTHVVWYVESARYALDVVAERHGLTLEPLDPVEVPRSPRATAYAHLTRSLHGAAREALGDDATPRDIAHRWRARQDYRVARHLARLAEAAPAVDALERADVGALLETAVDDLAAADEALVAFVHTAGAERDADLVHYLDRRLQRAAMLLGPPDALLVQHVPMQPLPDRA